ncbi:hypothetical protein AXF42_Ash019798 [Apostasia shenzhenica]|uniref:Uncharacterized protein n=1 Tax=Apostasia shenzhenica TaxID=1088818 RepID=A0A2I0AA49_9ASPA|nr:hypothetical protein AXF42_Ash019798 [Apostasia shenzhenica]
MGKHSMDFLGGGLAMTRRGHDRILIFINVFSKVIKLISCKSTIKGRRVPLAILSTRVGTHWAAHINYL